ncbi:MAG: helix-turn-helix transcriptional regulator [Colwellia sp.]|nr:helix-turn-helix transcriptional regulator [Colwellia sp.]
MIEFILLLLGSAHGFYLSFALLTKNNTDNNTNLLLALFVFALALRLSFMVVDVSGFLDLSPHLIELDAPIAFLFGPLLFLYVKKLSSPSFYKVNFIHFLPFILAIVISLPFYWQSAEFKLAWLLDFPTTELGLWYLNLFELIFIPLKLVLLAIYMVLVYQRLMQHRADITDDFSNIEKINLTWLIRLFSTLGLLFFCWVFNEIIEFYLDFCSKNVMGVSCDALESTSNNLKLLTEYGMVICFYLISIYGLKQPAIFNVNTRTKSIKTSLELSEPQDVEDITDVQKQQVIGDTKYQKSSLTEELSTKVYQAICRLISQHNLYLEPELSLSQLALESGFSKHHLSQAINQCANKTFFDFINCLRIEHAKSLLHGENNMNVQEVSLAAGFNSRSAFYNAFKKHTQLTPSQYKKMGTIKTCAA